MLRTLFVICAGFGLGAIVCAVQYALIRAGRFRRNPYIGLAMKVTRQSDAAWNRGHAAAAVWFGRAGMLAAAASAVAGAGLAFARESLMVTAFVVLGGFLGAAAAGMIRFGAEPAARRAAEEAEPGEDL